MCFGVVAVAIDAVIKSKMKEHWELLIVGNKIFLGVSQNLADRILQ